MQSWEDDRNRTKYIGEYGYGERNERGEKLLNFLEEHKLFMMNSFFKKNINRKWTWQSPDGKTKNEIDYIMTNNKSIMKDVNVLNSFDVGSDHRMVRSIICINKKLERRRLHRPKSIIKYEELQKVKGE